MKAALHDPYLINGIIWFERPWSLLYEGYAKVM